ncbi:hypothetical protein [Paraburkholderia sp. RAU2J]|uniref:hypothetical protein n=1 Tax=Paraburkholderia sp. RAU2J TaxID=1938810 RepID=UPI0018F3DB41|nr:hypothetical protein [Paraburkholderia sp. RAU2J]
MKQLVFSTQEKRRKTKMRLFGNLNNHVDFPHRFMHLPQPLGVRFEEQRIAAGEVNRVFAAWRESMGSSRRLPASTTVQRTAISRRVNANDA